MRSSAHSEAGSRPHANSVAARRPHAAPLASSSAPHTPTAAHASPERMFTGATKLGIGARLKAASFSYRTRPSRDRSPNIREENLGSGTSIANGAPGSFRFRSVTTASFFRSRNKEKKQDQEVTKESGDTVTTRM